MASKNGPSKNGPEANGTTDHGTTDERRLRLLVDGDKCQGHNRCHVLLPELIDVDDLGFAKVLDDGLVPPELAEKARLAVRNCPEFALRLTTSTKGDAT